VILDNHSILGNNIHIVRISKHMSLPRINIENLTEDEKNELIALKCAINYAPSSVHPDKQERFTELFVRSLGEKGDPVSLRTNPTNY